MGDSLALSRPAVYARQTAQGPLGHRKPAEEVGVLVYPVLLSQGSGAGPKAITLKI